MEKITLTTLQQRKSAGTPIAMLTCYDFSTAVLLQTAGVESLLVGDSLAQVVLGYPTTLSATMEVMIPLTAAVRRGAPEVYLVGDMPFLSYQLDINSAIRNAGRFLTEAGCDAVKLEVDERYTEVVSALARAGIPVMAHLGVRPQTVHQMGQFKAQGRTAEEARRLSDQARLMVEAGASSLLLECVTREVAAEITQSMAVPVIGCGSGPDCDGQVLVIHDLLALPGAGTARFAKAYAQMGDQIRQAAAAYVSDIHQRIFPDDAHSYHRK